jgi:acetoin:2,6-dichlorophenolindophenol oxidoreductase subunit alpha
MAGRCSGGGEAGQLVNNTAEEQDAARLFRSLIQIRRFEEACQALFLRGAISGSIHLGMGQEAVSVGVCDVLGDDDIVASTYRGHGQALALGVDPAGLLAEMLGRASGTCGGRSGSMNVADLKHRLLGCFGIVGGSIAAATGAGLHRKLTGAGVAVAFFGDGAVNQAYFHECVNFAAVQRLPVVFVCENNLYGEFTPMSAVTAGEITARAGAYGITASQVDGNDVWAVRAAADAAACQAREGRGPVFLEALTYRFNDHARGDPVRYRPDGELEEWRRRDPLTIAAARLTTNYRFAQHQIDEILAEVTADVARIRATVLQHPLPSPADLGSEFKIGAGRTDG